MKLTDSRWGRRFLVRITAVLCGVIVASVGVFSFFARTPDLTVLCSNNRDSCEALVESFGATHDYRIELLRVPTSQALERLQGAQTPREFDVWIGGPTSAYATAEASGLLAQIEPLILPLETPSKNRSWFEIYGGILSLCVADGVEINSWDQLAHTSHRVVAPNPLTSGTAATFLALQYQRLGDDAAEYLRHVDEAVITYTDSGIAPAQLVANGQADIGVTFAPYCERLRADGAPVHTVFPLEGTDYEVGGAAMLAGARHEKAAMEFLTFVTSPEGQNLGASAAHQAPIVSAQHDTLDDHLRDLPVPLLHTDPYLLAERLPTLVRMWEQVVYHGSF